MLPPDVAKVHLIASIAHNVTTPFQRSTPPRLPQHAPDLQDRGNASVADCDRCSLTSLTKRAFVTSLRFA